MSGSIESLARESRCFPPEQGFVRAARVDVDRYRELYARSMQDPEGFWAERAAELTWFQPPREILQWDPPKAQWFRDGTTNLAFNCLDRHLDGPMRHKLAILWEAESGETRQYTYQQLHDRVCRLANVLLQLGIGSGDRVGIYMGMVPEAIIAMLACARIGAIHSVVFGGFAADALRDRMNDAGAKLVITQDVGFRRGKPIPLKQQVDKALQQCSSVDKVLVLRRAGIPLELRAGREFCLESMMQAASPRHDAPPLAAEHPLFILYTSGTTGKPKGVLHTTGGYMVGVHATTKAVFDLRDEDLYFCTADVGWITGHSYVAYGPLLCGASLLIYEGAPDHPDPGRLWAMIERHKVSILYTAPTAIRAFVRQGDRWPQQHDLSSLRLLGTVGEPINPEAWMWYRRVIGGERCPIVDTYWQTETGAIMVTPLPGAHPQKPGSCALPFFGVSPVVLRGDGSECDPDEGGYLVIDKPWPSMLRGVWGDEQRFREQYFSRFPGRYFTGDGARRDRDGYFWVMGRVDDVVNVAGHRLGTAEIESVLVAHPEVAEAAVVGRPDEIKGQALVAFVTLKQGCITSSELQQDLSELVAREIGRFARPEEVRFADALPKTRSGKIMRRLLAELAAGKTPAGDVTTLEDLSVLARLRPEED